MSRTARAVAVLVLAAGLLGAELHAELPEEDVGLVAHGDLVIEALSAQDARRILLGGRSTWTTGERIVLVLPPPGSPEMRWICATLRVSERLYRRGLMEKALLGDISKPMQARDPAHAVELTAATRGAVTAVAMTDEDGVHRVRIDH